MKPTHEQLIGAALIGVAIDMDWLVPRDHPGFDLPRVLRDMGELDIPCDDAVQAAMRITESVGPVMDVLLMRLTYANAYDELKRRLA